MLAGQSNEARAKLKGMCRLEFQKSGKALDSGKEVLCSGFWRRRDRRGRWIEDQSRADWRVRAESKGWEDPVCLTLGKWPLGQAVDSQKMDLQPLPTSRTEENTISATLWLGPLLNIVHTSTERRNVRSERDGSSRRGLDWGCQHPS